MVKSEHILRLRFNKNLALSFILFLQRLELSDLIRLVSLWWSSFHNGLINYRSNGWVLLCREPFYKRNILILSASPSRTSFNRIQTEPSKHEQLLNQYGSEQAGPRHWRMTRVRAPMESMNYAFQLLDRTWPVSRISNRKIPFLNWYCVSTLYKIHPYRKRLNFFVVCSYIGNNHLS